MHRRFATWQKQTCSVLHWIHEDFIAIGTKHACIFIFILQYLSSNVQGCVASSTLSIQVDSFAPVEYLEETIHPVPELLLCVVVDGCIPMLIPHIGISFRVPQISNQFLGACKKVIIQYHLGNPSEYIYDTCTHVRTSM